MSGRVITIDAVEIFLRVEAAKKGAAEVPPGSNAGPYCDRILPPCGAKSGDPWCMADISDTGKLALAEQWPLPMTASCAEAAAFCEKHNALVVAPQRGDLWFLWSDHFGRFAHVGVVLSVSPDKQHVLVQAGNTVRPNEPGDIRDGWLNWTRTEPIAPKDRFGRWVDLL